MSWNDTLRQASFRGVRFKVRDNSGELGGRRVAVHEYPARDKAYAEDMGRKTREFTVTGYVVGDDFADQRDRLVDACAKPGPGVLVHPSLGSITAICTGCNVSERQEDGRMAVFSLSFIDASGKVLPKGAPDTAREAAKAAERYAEVSRQGFKRRYTPSGLPGWAAEELKNAASRIFLAAGRDKPAFDHMSASSLATGIQFAVRTMDFNQAATFAAKNTGHKTYPGETALGKKVSALSQDLAGFARRTGLARAASALADTKFGSRREALDAFQALDRHVETELHAASLDGDDDLFFAAQDIRAASSRDVSARAANLPDLKTSVTVSTEPALVAAYRHAGSAGKAGDLVNRNQVRHPGFVHGGAALEVLEDAR